MLVVPVLVVVTPVVVMPVPVLLKMPVVRLLRSTEPRIASIGVVVRDCVSRAERADRARPSGVSGDHTHARADAHDEIASAPWRLMTSVLFIFATPFGSIWMMLLQVTGAFASGTSYTLDCASTSAQTIYWVSCRFFFEASISSRRSLPYLPSFTSPTPLTLSSRLSVVGFISEIAPRVSSSKTM